MFGFLRGASSGGGSEVLMIGIALWFATTTRPRPAARVISRNVSHWPSLGIGWNSMKLDGSHGRNIGIQVYHTATELSVYIIWCWYNIWRFLTSHGGLPQKIHGIFHQDGLWSTRLSSWFLHQRALHRGRVPRDLHLGAADLLGGQLWRLRRSGAGWAELGDTQWIQRMGRYPLV